MFERQWALTCASIVLAVALSGGCGKAPEPAKPTGGGAAADAGHSGGDHHAPGHGGAVIDLGAVTVVGFAVKATRDEGSIEAGGDAPIDVTITGADGEGRKVTAVRFWVGLRDAKGSVKARADIENPNEPNRWHTHAEVPDPLPGGSRLWIEIELDQGGPLVADFDLRR